MFLLATKVCNISILGLTSIMYEFHALSSQVYNLILQHNFNKKARQYCRFSSLTNLWVQCEGFLRNKDYLSAQM